MFFSNISSIFHNHSRPLVGVAALCSAIILGVTGFLLIKDYDNAIRHAEQHNGVLTQVLEENARRAFDLSKASLYDLSRDFVTNEHSVITPELKSRMVNWLDVNPLIASFWIFDEVGNPIFTTQDIKTDGVNFSDRKYFNAHKRGEDIYVGEMTRGRLDGKWFFSLSRRLTDKDGAFRGVVLASMSADYFSRLYQKLGLGTSDNIGIYKLDGSVVARRLRNWAGDQVPTNSSSIMFTKLADSPVGVYRSNSPIDGIERIIAYRLVEGWPLVVAAGSAVVDIMDERLHRAIWTVCFCLIILIVIWIAVFWGLHIDNLRRRLNDAANRDIMSARVAAERANAAKSRFLASASHDLRQPLHALCLYLGSLSHKVGREHAPTILRMEQCIAGFQHLLTDLVELARLDAHVIKPRHAEFSLNSLLQRIAAANLSIAESKGLRLKIVRTKLKAYTDEALFGRILGNLISNAVRYTERGGVVIGCRRREGKVWLEICDTGIGIPTDKLDAIFEEFNQLAEQRQNLEYGSGLGLAIVRRSADVLGLETRVTSKLGKGSMFAIQVPLLSENRFMVT